MVIFLFDILTEWLLFFIISIFSDSIPLWLDSKKIPVHFLLMFSELKFKTWVSALLRVFYSRSATG